MILPDTSVWVDHFRHGDQALIAFLNTARVACHPLIIGELACGNLGGRAEVLRNLAALPSLARATDDEVLTFIETHQLMGCGLGIVDMHLLAACALSRVPLWTRDVRLARAADRLALAARLEQK